jgi:hypothetical protein
VNITEATRSYESWLGRLTPLSQADLRLKHQQMREDLFSFLRATYYRWAQIWAEACPDLARDHAVLAVGDLHVENFGTWRDLEGRLVWGVNDFDECYELPFSNDLVRLAVSAAVAIEARELSIAPEKAAEEILEGYQAALQKGGQPLVLVDASTPLREMVRYRLATPERFWNKLRGFPALRTSVPKKVNRAIEKLLPDKQVPLKFVHRTAGLGSLGKQRFTAIGAWLGGQICREAKALTPSAVRWAEGKKPGGMIHYDKILRRAIRCRDPLVVVRGEWLVRRLSQDCFRIPLSHLPRKRNERDLLYFMGWETANIHLGTAKASRLARELKNKPARWLSRASRTMRDACFQDWKHWRKKAI